MLSPDWLTSSGLPTGTSFAAPDSVPGPPPGLELTVQLRQSSTLRSGFFSTSAWPPPFATAGHGERSIYFTVDMVRPFLSRSLRRSPCLFSRPTHGPSTRTFALIL